MAVNRGGTAKVREMIECFSNQKPAAFCRFGFKVFFVCLV